MDELSKRLRLGDPAALEEAMDRYAPYAAKIIAVFLNKTLPPEDMEEVLSDVFVSLWTHRADLRGRLRRGRQKLKVLLQERGVRHE